MAAVCFILIKTEVFSGTRGRLSALPVAYGVSTSLGVLTYELGSDCGVSTRYGRASPLNPNVPQGFTSSTYPA
jgi:hypothetical protein